jgi:hypothetical protein
VAQQINLEVLDTPDVDQTQFGSDMKRWLSNIVDIINANFTTIANVFSSLITTQSINIGGSGAGPISVTVTGLTSSGFVTATLISSSNPVTILSIAPTTNAFNITFSGDPGASAIIVYQAFTAAP